MQVARRMAEDNWRDVPGPRHRTTLNASSSSAVAHHHSSGGGELGYQQDRPLSPVVLSWGHGSGFLAAGYTQIRCFP
jgi:hypothetical protein